MNRIIATLSKGLVIATAAGALAAVSLVTTRAEAQWRPPPPEVYVVSEPVWYQGHPHYWYGNHWYWRDEHGAWQHYEHEPPFLVEHHRHHPVEYRRWGHWHR
ncbi:MAG: hypothetical protein ACRELB_07925 [Polyangiaceae bacterium]